MWIRKLQWKMTMFLLTKNEGHRFGDTCFPVWHQNRLSISPKSVSWFDLCRMWYAVHTHTHTLRFNPWDFLTFAEYCRSGEMEPTSEGQVIDCDVVRILRVTYKWLDKKSKCRGVSSRNRILHWPHALIVLGHIDAQHAVWSANSHNQNLPFGSFIDLIHKSPNLSLFSEDLDFNSGHQQFMLADPWQSILWID